MDEDYEKALGDYYELKKAYGKAWKKIKAKIKRLDLPMEKKRERLKKAQRKCIYCRRKGGTIFTEEKGHLKAICAHSTPCKLHIEIKKIKWVYLPTALENTRQIIEMLKRRIIMVKLEFLFDLEKEEATIQKFDRLKTLFEKTFTYLTSLETTQTNNYRLKDRMNTIEENRLQIYTLQEEFKEMIQNYQESHNSTALKDAVELYIEQIIPREQENQELQYATLYVDVEIGGNLLEDASKSEKHDGNIKFFLKGKKIDILQKEELWEEGQVIANIK